MTSNAIDQCPMTWVFEEPFEILQSNILEGLKTFGDATSECGDRIYEYLPVCPNGFEFFCKQDNYLRAFTAITALGAIGFQLQNLWNDRCWRTFSDNIQHENAINHKLSKLCLTACTISLIYFYVQEHILAYDA